MGRPLKAPGDAKGSQLGVRLRPAQRQQLETLKVWLGLRSVNAVVELAIEQLYQGKRPEHLNRTPLPDLAAVLEGVADELRRRR